MISESGISDPPTTLMGDAEMERQCQKIDPLVRVGFSGNFAREGTVDVDKIESC